MQKGRISLMTFGRKHFGTILALAAVPCLLVGQAHAQVSSGNGFTVFTPNGPQPGVDFVRAKALQMPINNVPQDQIQAQIAALMSPPALGNPGASPGGAGNGAETPVFLGAPEGAGDDGMGQEMFGTNNHPFSTARADLTGLATNRNYPYRPSGKLYFKIGASTFICSASLIKRGIVVTAAHCVANFGKKQFYGSWQFIPGYRSGVAPFGVWTVAQAWIKTSYYNGTDSCAVAGVVCANDVAILVLNQNAGAYAGTATGWYGYGWNGFGFAGSQTHITQIGYPAGLDSASLMERNDSSGFVSAANSNNTVIGSNMDGGSSGGPWLVNFGIKPTNTGETDGTAPNPNIVVGVTSWGYISKAPKEQGASPFTNTNVWSLVNSACTSIPAACL